MTGEQQQTAASTTGAQEHTAASKARQLHHHTSAASTTGVFWKNQVEGQALMEIPTALSHAAAAYTYHTRITLISH
jgi:hypothetical protein